MTLALTTAAALILTLGLLGCWAGVRIVRGLNEPRIIEREVIRHRPATSEHVRTLLREMAEEEVRYSGSATPYQNMYNDYRRNNPDLGMPQLEGAIQTNADWVSDEAAARVAPPPAAPRTTGSPHYTSGRLYLDDRTIGTMAAQRYVQWNSPEELEALMQDPEVARAMKGDGE